MNRRKTPPMPVCSARMMIRTAVVATLAVAGLVAAVHYSRAGEPPHLPDPAFATLIDDDATLLASDRSRITLRLENEPKVSGATIVVAIPHSLNGAEPADFASALAERIGLDAQSGGQSVLLLIAETDHRLAILPSASFKAHFSPEETRMLVATRIVPSLENVDLAKAIWDGLDGIEHALATDPTTLDREARDWAAARDRAEGNGDYITIGMAVVVGLMLVLSGWRWWRTRGNGKAASNETKGPSETKGH